MKKIFTLIIFPTILFFGMIFSTQVQAQLTPCSFFPCSEVNEGKPFTDKGVATQVEDWIRFGVNMVFIGLIFLGVFIIIKSALKYIRSQGDETKIQEGAAAIRSVFIGIGMLFIGIAGILLVLVITGGLDLLERDTTKLPDGVETVPFLN